MRRIDKAAAVILRGGLLLVVRKRGSTTFISPGGKPEPGERMDQALARELTEETGLHLRSWQRFGTYSDRAAFEPSSTVRIEVFLAEADGTATPGQEIEEVAWIDGGFREAGIELGSIFDHFVVPALLAQGLLRPGSMPSLGRPAERTIIVDLDGTIAFDGGHPGPKVSAALDHLGERSDIHLVVATSRAPRGARKIMGALADRVDEWWCCNGAFRTGHGRETETTALPCEPLRAMIACLRAEAVPFYLEYGDRFVVSGGGFSWMAYPDRAEYSPDADPDLATVIKLVVDSQDSALWICRLRDSAGDDVEICLHAGGVIDITAAGVTKAKPLDLRMNANGSVVVAFGNDLNDQELLARADVAFVVGIGLPGLERARHVRRVSADDAAVATALWHVVSIPASDELEA
ncbi:NUDIX domain-containing protein [Cryobacterium sp. TMT1-3]|uniref:NUDIX domain-containing protein n=3 Tax=Cryobacterium TaxID=69578 RepID=A0A4R8ZXQ7_9MICO|nr:MULTISPECIES: HAD hydrolase family protein [Cryobacterium]RJT90023.1 NUDIX domain-containing protein [Cryobacterium melibiosiphilum]TFB84238.1 NUDIX domain-containing protein [Cryobacterium luteum]TFC30682.1 NUDIX domain-containing protein [Cryobacterium sp. TMT1-3]TFD48532.1 NUDIX domain-containing protein [Cryobacterium frigoriphilum]SEO08762.1 hypothetical protein SAMN05216281_1323 [Cryobacterium luteum]